MTTSQVIVQHIAALPEPALREVLDFVEFLEMKNRATVTGSAEEAWSRFSLDSAMRGMEDEPSPYTVADLQRVSP